MSHRISFAVTYVDSLPGVGVKDSEAFVREAIEAANLQDPSGCTISDISVTLVEFEEVDE